MNKEQLEEQIYHYTGKKIEVNDDDIKNADIFIKNAEEYHKEKYIDEMIDAIRHDLYLYYQYTYNMNNENEEYIYSCNNSYDLKKLVDNIGYKE